VLMVLNFVAAFLSTAKKEGEAMDAETAEAAKALEGI
jgi:hypothetical protein